MSLKNFIPGGVFGLSSEYRNEALSAFRDDVVDIIQDAVTELVEGGQDDLATFANDIADSAIKIMGEPDEAIRSSLMAEIGQQLVLIAEMNRIRAVHANWVAVTAVVRAAVSTAIKMIVPL